MKNMIFTTLFVILVLWGIWINHPYLWGSCIVDITNDELLLNGQCPPSYGTIP